MPPSLYYSVKPLQINQAFGANAAYYAKFLDSAGDPQKGHPGIDFMASHGQPVFAAHDGDAIYLKDAHGGEGIWIFAEGFATIYWHLIGDTDPAYKLPIPFDGARHSVKAGDIIGYADNTGAPYESSGDHLHFGLVHIQANGTIANQDNGFDGCIDPTPYFNGQYACDVALAAIKAQATQLANAVQAVKPTDPNAVVETSFAARVIALIEQELRDFL